MSNRLANGLAWLRHQQRHCGGGERVIISPSTPAYLRYKAGSSLSWRLTGTRYLRALELSYRLRSLFRQHLCLTKTDAPALQRSEIYAHRIGGVETPAMRCWRSKTDAPCIRRAANCGERFSAAWRTHTAAALDRGVAFFVPSVRT